MPISANMAAAVAQLADKPIHIGTIHYVSALYALQQSKHVPTQFDPDSYCNFEICLCSMFLHQLEDAPIDRKHLSHVAYMSYLLDGVMLVGTEEHSINLEAAIERYKLRERNKREAKFDELIIRCMAHPDASKIPNIIRAIFLVQYVNFIVLPKIINRLQQHNEFSFREDKTQTLEYYQHLTTRFIPNLFMILRLPGVISDIRIVGQLGKLFIQFPLALFPQIAQFIEALTEYVLKNIRGCTIYEIFSILKLIEFAEVSHNRSFLRPEGKVVIVNALVARKQELGQSFIGMLMGMQFTVFRELRGRLRPFNIAFTQFHASVQQRFANSTDEHPAELTLYGAILEHLPDQHKRNLKLNYICPETGREIDMAYIDTKDEKPVRVAINIDGKDYHYVPGTERENRKTMIRNSVLGNAGWVVICQPLCRYSELEASDSATHMPTVRASLLEKLKGIIPITDKVQNKTGITPPQSGSPARKRLRRQP